MSDSHPETAGSGEFKTCFDALQKAGDGARKTIYVFVLVYGALLLWALNATIYPAEQSRLTAIQKEATSIVACLDKSQNSGGRLAPDDTCNTVLSGEQLATATLTQDKTISNGGEWAYIGPAAAGSTVTDPAQNQWHAKFQEATRFEYPYLQNKINDAYTSSAKTARFDVPIFGIASDRTWLWLVNITLGLLFYYLLKASLANGRDLLEYTTENVAKAPLEFRLLRTTQAITQSPGWFGEWCKKTLLFLIFAFPLIVSMLLIRDWYNRLFLPGAHPDPGSAFPLDLGLLTIPHISAQFASEPEALGGFLTVLVLPGEIVLFASLWRSVLGLFRLSAKMAPEPAESRHRALLGHVAEATR